MEKLFGSNSKQLETARDAETSNVSEIFNNEDLSILTDESIQGAEDASSDDPGEAVAVVESAPSGKASQAETLVKLASQSATYFRTLNNEHFAMVHINNHVETWPIRSRQFKEWLSYLLYSEINRPPNNQSLMESLNILAAQAQFDGHVQDVFVRVAGHERCVYVDLCNSRWQQVRINADGWKVIDGIDSPVLFKRTPGMAPLSPPLEGQSLDILPKILNLENENEWILMASWLVGALKPSGPFPILLLQGEQGTSKSTTARLMKDLIDPSTVPLRTLPTTERDLAISSSHTWVLNFDNLSGMRAKISDALCRLATGGGFSTRKLHTDDTEVLFNSVRPIIMNGISDIATRHDLADRSLIINLPHIPKQLRKPEREIMELWESIKQGLLGALYDAVSMALRNENDVRLSSLPRMADFAQWVAAAENALPWENGKFIDLYNSNQDKLIDIAIEADPVALTVIEFIDCEHGYWSGTATELMHKLTVYAIEFKGLPSWPKKPNILSGRLKRCATFLRVKGIEIFWSKSGDRTITIRKISDTTAQDDQQGNEPSGNLNGTAYDGDFDAPVLPEGSPYVGYDFIAAELAEEDDGGDGGDDCPDDWEQGEI
jgi:hypothetical protein